MGKRKRRRKKNSIVNRKKQRKKRKKKRRNKRKRENNEQFFFHQVSKLQDYQPPKKKRKLDHNYNVSNPNKIDPRFISSSHVHGKINTISSRVTIDESRNVYHVFEQNLYQFKDYDHQIKTICPLCDIDTDLEVTDDPPLIVFCDNCASYIHADCAKIKKMSFENISNYYICRKCKYGVYDSKKRKKGQFGCLTHRFLTELIDEVRCSDKDEILKEKLDVLSTDLSNGKFKNFGPFHKDFLKVFDQKPGKMNDNITFIKFDLETNFDMWRLSKNCSIKKMEDI